MSIGRKVNRKGRSRGVERFVMLYHYLLRSPAWQHLTPVERCLLVELYSRFTGNNNGDIGLGCREAAMALGVSPNSASRAFRELAAKGFVEATSRGAFTRKNRFATTWRLTEFGVGDELPTKDFMRWQPS